MPGILLLGGLLHSHSVCRRHQMRFCNVLVLHSRPHKMSIQTKFSTFDTIYLCHAASERALAAFAERNAVYYVCVC